MLAGDGAVLVSRFKSTEPVSVVFEGGRPERMQVHLLDREHDLEPVAAEPAGNVLALPAKAPPSGSSPQPERKPYHEREISS